ncbi:general transcription factor II-I repeat domain-containing protein 2-like [Macrobrachium nipponense]|uniref:general transcription factor II-I repeat domain-containing protein 2-like n=1 Tax=Macrobrachium nipponense TaxID=159736 RepID=UPI0030C8D24A
MPVSARAMERCISEMTDNVSQQQMVALTSTPVISVALDESMDINSIPSLAVFARYSDTEHREFQAFLEEVDSVYKDIPFRRSVRWLSCGKVLERFVECFDEIQIFLSEKGQDYPELEDRDWIVKLKFLSDITKHLNDLNLLLQGAGKTVMDLYDTWKVFVAKLAVYSTDIKTGFFPYFKNLKNLSAIHPVNTTNIQLYMQELRVSSQSDFNFSDDSYNKGYHTKRNIKAITKYKC